jgi:DNA anti-recombination protein RmuC
MVGGVALCLLLVTIGCSQSATDMPKNGAVPSALSRPEPAQPASELGASAVDADQPTSDLGASTVDAEPSATAPSTTPAQQSSLETVQTSLEKLNEQAAASLDEAVDNAADAIEETTDQLKQSFTVTPEDASEPLQELDQEATDETIDQLKQDLEATAEDASESLQELNQEAAKVLDEESSKAANAINAEIEQAKNLQP